MPTVIADLVIRNGSIVSHDAVIAASVAIKDGRVLSVGVEEAMPPARETFDAAGLHVLPGAIDIHVHFRDPGYPAKEDWATGTAAAAFGGVTTVFDMPNTIPPTGNAEVLAAKHEIAASKAYIDFGPFTDCSAKTRSSMSPHWSVAASSVLSSTWAILSARFRRPRPALCWRPSRSLRRQASASRFMPRQIRSWSGARSDWQRRVARIHWPTSHRGPQLWPSKRSAALPSSRNGQAPEFTFCIFHRLRNCGRCARGKRGV